ncbi:MAG: Lysine-tRNA ligase, partial [Candidatus Yanofskybacteria bacterium GW2011_GWA2_44_10]
MPLEDIRNIKIDKVKRLRSMGLDPYPTVSERTHNISQVLESFDSLSDAKTVVSLCGRVTALRAHGGSIFADINDGSGKIQALAKEDILGQDKFKTFEEFFDIGD